MSKNLKKLTLIRGGGVRLAIKPRIARRKKEREEKKRKMKEENNE